MNCFVVVQVLILVTVALTVNSSPAPEPTPKEMTEEQTFVVKGKPDFPVADQIEEDKNIKTHVIGKMDDLEATTWISSLSELNFTFPPDMAKSLEHKDFDE